MKERRCKVKSCRTKFEITDKTKPWENWCSESCQTTLIQEALAKAQKQRKRAQERAKKAQKKANARQKRDYNADKLSHQVELTQRQFNGLIVLLDKDDACGSCGRCRCGSGWDCGHVKSTGSHPELRFDFLNAYKQGSACNRSNRLLNSQSLTISKQYEERIIKTKGQWVMDYLNGPHKAKHYTREGLKVLRTEFAAERRYIEKHGQPSRDWRQQNG